MVFFFSPRTLGKWSNNLTSILQIGWNHQLVIDNPTFLNHRALELEPWAWRHGCIWRFPHQHLCREGSLPANLLWTYCARTTQRDLSTRLAISRWYYQTTECFTYTSDTSGFLGSIVYIFPNDLGRFRSSEHSWLFLFKVFFLLFGIFAFR